MIISKITILGNLGELFINQKIQAYYLIIIISLSTISPLYVNFNLFQQKNDLTSSNDDQIEIKNSDIKTQENDQKGFIPPKPKASYSPWDLVGAGEYRVDIDYRFSIDYPFALFLPIGNSGIFDSANIDVISGSQTRSYYKTSYGLWDISGRISMAGYGTTIVDFDHVCTYLYTDWGFTLPYDIPIYLSHSITPETEGSTFKSGTYRNLVWLSTWTSTYPVAHVNSLSTTVPYIDSPNTYDINFNVENPTTWDSWTGSVIIERKVGSGAWTMVYGWADQTIDSNGGEKPFSFTDSYNTASSDVNIQYQVKLFNSHFLYKSSSTSITINPSRPFISSLSVFLTKEYFDLGRLNPTEEIYLDVYVTNPTAGSVTKTIQFDRGFADASKVSSDAKSIIINSGQTEKVRFEANLLDGYLNDEEYLIPGLMPNVLFYDAISHQLITLDEWSWCDLNNGELFETEKLIEFSVWIVEGVNKESLKTITLTTFIPQLKASSLIELRHLISRKRELGDLSNIFSWGGIITTSSGAAVSVLGALGLIGTTGGPVGLVISLTGVLFLGLGFLTEYELQQIKKQIVELMIIILDPPDLNIYEIVPIIYEPLDIDIDDSLLKDSDILEIYNVVNLLNKIEDVTKALRITQERYTAAIMLNEDTAAKLQANVLHDYTQIKINYLNTYISTIKGLYDDFTIENIILKNGSVTMDDVYSVINEGQRYIFNNGGFLTEERQYMREQGYTNDEIDEIESQFLLCDIDEIDNDLVIAYNNYNSNADYITSEKIELINGIYRGINEIKYVSENLDSEIEFTVSVNTPTRVFETEIKPIYQNSYNGGSASYSLEITNLLEVQAITLDITIENIYPLNPTFFTYPKTININPLETEVIDIDIFIPDNIPPTLLNPNIIIATYINGKPYIESRSFILNINDDDITPALVFLKHKGKSTDGEPGFIELSFNDDESEASANLIIKGPNGFNYINAYSIEGSYIIDLEVINVIELGIYEVTFDVENNDEDGWIGDEEINSYQITIDIRDDDILAPQIFNLEIIDTIHNIQINFNAFDDDSGDDSGLSLIKIYIDDKNVLTEYPLINQEFFNFTIVNNWIMQRGRHSIRIEIWDADDDREKDNSMYEIYDTFECTLDDLYVYVIWQLEEIKEFVETNLSHSLSRYLRYKLVYAQTHLIRASELVMKDKTKCALIHNFIAQALVQLSDFKIDFLEKIGLIDNNIAQYITSSLRNIRNNIVILMGETEGSYKAKEMALTIIELYKTEDLINDELKSCYRWYITSIISLAIIKLNFAIFGHLFSKTINYILSFTQYLLERARQKVNKLLDKGKISEELLITLLGNLDSIIEKIEQLKSI